MRSKQSSKQEEVSPEKRYQDELREHQELQKKLRQDLEKRIILERNEHIEMIINAVDEIKKEYDHTL